MRWVAHDKRAVPRCSVRGGGAACGHAVEAHTQPPTLLPLPPFACCRAAREIPDSTFVIVLCASVSSAVVLAGISCRRRFGRCAHRARPRVVSVTFCHIPRWWCRLAVAVGVTATQCVALLVLSAQRLQTSAESYTCLLFSFVATWPPRLRACDVRRLHDRMHCETLPGLVYVHHLQALPREPTAAPACAFAANGTALMTVPPALLSPVAEACHFSAVCIGIVPQHRADDRLRAAGPSRANRPSPLTSIIVEVGVARSQRCRVATALMILHATVATLL
jgi:hypothetical protein